MQQFRHRSNENLARDKSRFPFRSFPMSRTCPSGGEQAGLARVGAVGIASLALLSGFGAVNLPYQQLATLFRRVPNRCTR